MSFKSHSQIVEALLDPLNDAANVILSTRDKGLVVEHKSDESPVTEADRLAEGILTRALREILPEVPVVAEESSAAGSTPAIGSMFVLLDPLDGTRDYCAGRDDFTINIGLIKDGRPVFGLILAPARRELFFTRGPGEAVAAVFDPAAAPTHLADLKSNVIHVRTAEPGRLSALVSRREAGSEFDSQLAALGVVARTGASSAVKFGHVARGDADIYPRFGPTCEWDTAAGQAIVEAAGGTVTALDGSPLVYGKASTKFLNGPFVARGRLAPI